MEDRRRGQTIWPSAGGLFLKLILSYTTVSSLLATASGSPFDSWFGGANQLPFFSSPVSTTHKVSTTSRDHDFQLRHIFEHGTHRYPNVHVRTDVDPQALHTFLDDDGEKQSLPNSFRVRSHNTIIERLTDRRVPTMQTMYHHSRLTGLPASLDPSAWTVDEVAGPNTTDKETVINLAKMSWCAYTKEPGTGEWQDIGGGFNESQGLGWEGDSLRGHIFADKDNSTIVIAIKGTSPGMFKYLYTATMGVFTEEPCSYCGVRYDYSLILSLG